VVAVEEVTSGAARRRFAELPHALSGTDPRFAPLLMAWERYRIDPHRNPYFDHGEAALFLARRMGRPAGRIAAHLAAPGAEGRFGFWWVDDDADVAAALVEAAQVWLTERGRSSMAGPWSFTAEEEAGLLVEGVDVPGATGRPWHPEHLARRLEAQGFRGVEDRPAWRLPVPTHADHLPAGPPTEAAVPGQAGAYVDRRLVLDGIAAVPDVAEALRTSGLRSAWALATRARAGAWATATVVRCTDDPAVAVPALRAAAAAAGYRALIAPWTDTDAPPETVHRIFQLDW
jgi:hypothetical protein